MLQIRETEVFSVWLSRLRDQEAKAKIVSRIRRLALGNAGDVAPVGSGVSEMRIHHDPGYRVYFTNAERNSWCFSAAETNPANREISTVRGLLQLYGGIRPMPLKTKPFDPAVYLKTNVARAAYMTEALETGDAAFIADAVGVLARARGMSKVAKEAGLSRESLYRALSPEGNPEFSTVLKVMAALHLKLKAAPGGNP